jgi:UDP-N-acetylmuramate--alanine ligase
VKDKKALPAKLNELAQPGDIIITMGAGDIYQYGEDFVSMLEDEKTPGKTAKS